MVWRLVTPGHYLNQCWVIVNHTKRNKLQWNFKQNFYIFIQENAFEDVVCEMVAILARDELILHQNVVPEIESL